MIKDTLVFINPKSRQGQAQHVWEEACKKFPELPRDPIDVTTIDVGKYISKMRPRVVVIAGGDGTINSVCAAVAGMTNKPMLSIVPLGFGNALSYCLGVETLEKAVDVILHPDKKITVDMMKTNIPHHDRGVFSVSVGFSARIVFQRQAYKYIGFGSYIISAIQSIFKHPEKEMTFTIDKNVTLTAMASSLIVANSPVIGLNYVVAPNARLNDGLLDCTLISTKYAELTNLRLRGFKHPLYSEIGKVRFKAKHISVDGEPFVQIDGDPVKHKGRIEVEILPSQITFLRNKDKNINQEYLPFVA
jgi:diacylglycerol kinase (ATP)